MDQDSSCAMDLEPCVATFADQQVTDTCRQQYQCDEYEDFEIAMLLEEYMRERLSQEQWTIQALGKWGDTRALRHGGNKRSVIGSPLLNSKRFRGIEGDLKGMRRSPNRQLAPLLESNIGNQTGMATEAVDAMC